MDVISGPLIILDERDCAALGRQLVEAIRLGYVAPGRVPPRALVEFADQVNRVARSATFRADPQVSPDSGTTEPVSGTVLPASGEPVKPLTTKEAAALAGVSEGFMRRRFREGDPHGSRGRRGAWFVDAAELGAWLASQRRKDQERKAA